jgi:acetyl-CoA C-acetyltransferase
MDQARLPIIVGVGQVVDRPATLQEAKEPLELMEMAARAAAADTGRPQILARLDSLQVVNIISWAYEDAPGMLAQRLGATPGHTLYSGIGGETPQRLVGKAAAAIWRGEMDVCLIAGAEAMDSFMSARRQGETLPWTPRSTPRQIEDIRVPTNEIEQRHGATLPIRVYPLYENAIRARMGLSLEEHQRRLGLLCARMTEAAAQNPYAWFPIRRTPEEIVTVTPQNRMICFPYPKYMNAIMEVNQGAALILCSVDAARQLGIPQERWVYIWAGTYLTDKWFMSERPSFHGSLAQELVLQRALELAGLSPEEVDMFDFYSCFPSAVQAAMLCLGMDLDDPRPYTLTGGLPYAGGPGNNYCSHSIATAVERLRREPEKKAMITGMGWYFTKHSAGIYSGRPPRTFHPYDPREDEARIAAQPSPPLAEEAQGTGIVEAYTVVFGRDGEPEEGIVVGRLEEGPRFWANVGPDRELLWLMCREEFIGRRGHVRHHKESGRNLFSL